MLNKHSKGGINDYLSDTIKSVFSSVATSKCDTNRILFASNAYAVSEKSNATKSGNNISFVVLICFFKDHFRAFYLILEFWV